MLADIRDFFANLTLEKKILYGALAITIGELTYLIVKQNQKPREEHINRQFYKAITDENPIEGKSRTLVNIFVVKLSKDEELSKFFHPRTLRPHSLYAAILERYMLVAMGEPYVQIPIDLKQKHKNLKISNHHFDKWVELWKESEKELGLEGKNVWEEIRDDIVTVNDDGTLLQKH